MYFDTDMDLHIIALGLILMVVTSLYSFSPLPRYFFSSLYISHVLLIIFSILSIVGLRIQHRIYLQNLSIASMPLVKSKNMFFSTKRYNKMHITHLLIPSDIKVDQNHIGMEVLQRHQTEAPSFESFGKNDTNCTR